MVTLSRRQMENLLKKMEEEQLGDITISCSSSGLIEVKHTRTIPPAHWVVASNARVIDILQHTKEPSAEESDHVHGS